MRPDDAFAMDWTVSDGAEKHIGAIGKAVRGARKLFLATDPDREGEAISWHVRDELGRRGLLDGVAVQRVVFSEVTKSAVLDAMAAPRDLDDQPDRRLQGAARPRLPGGLHALAGALAQAPRLALGRPRAVRGAPADLRARGGDRGLQAARVLVDRGRSRTRPGASAWLPGSRSSTAKNSASTRSATKRPPRAPRALMRDGRYHVASVETKRVKRNPAPPFTTSTLQQEASRKLGFAARRTMQVAQQLYEGIAVGGEQVGPHHLHADRRRADRRAGAAPGKGRDRAALRQALRAREAPLLPHQGEERAGGARGDPPHRSLPRPAFRSQARSTRTRRGSTS